MNQEMALTGLQVAFVAAAIGFGFCLGLGLGMAIVATILCSFGELGRRIVKRWFPLIALLATSTLHAADPIASTNRIDWSQDIKGVSGGMRTNRSNLIDVTAAPYFADNTGSSDAEPAIQAAVDAAASNDVVYLPAGNYLTRGTISIGAKDHITLRGAGPTLTTIKAGLAGQNPRDSFNAIFVGSGSDWNWATPSSGNQVTGSYLTNGGTILPMSSTADFTVGQIGRLTFQNITNQWIQFWKTDSANNSLYIETKLITAKTSSNITVYPPIYTHLHAGGTAHFTRASQQADFVGLEGFTLDCTDNAQPFAIEFEQTRECWVYNCRVYNPANYPIFLYDSYRPQVQYCYIDNIQGEGSNGAGILYNTVSGALVQDNIIRLVFPLIEVNFGSSGNVFGYNFLWDSLVFGVVGAAIDSNHGPHNAWNLYEGNMAGNFQADGYFGSVSHDTFFRNWFHGQATGYTDSFTGSLNRFTRYYQLVGNIIGSNVTTGYISFGNPNMGNGSFTGTAEPSTGDWWVDWPTHPGPGGYQEQDKDCFNSANKVKNFVVQSNAFDYAFADTLPNSYYLPGKPDWFRSLDWPPMDPDDGMPAVVNTSRYEAIPAGYRWLNGTDPPPGTPCSDAPDITSTNTVYGTNGLAFSYQVTVDCTATNFTSGTLPTGLTLSSTLGLITGTPNVVSPPTTNVVSICATNAFGGSCTNVTFIIRAPDAVGGSGKGRGQKGGGGRGRFK